MVTGFAPAGSVEAQPSQEFVEVTMKNVNYRVSHRVVLQIRNLRGRYEATAPNRVISFDDPASFLVRIHSAEVAISPSSLAELLNSYVLGYPKAPLKNLSVTVAGTGLRVTGTMKKGLDLPFEIEGPLSATPDGVFRLHAQKIRSAHIPFKGLLHLFGEDLSKLVNVEEARGLSIAGDDLLMHPNRMTPPPHIEGQVTAVRVQGGNIIQVFGPAGKAASLLPPVHATNYIYHRGGSLRFGKLTMQDADLLIVDESPNTPFDFFLSGYNRQLVAGYSKNTPSHGLIVHMPDYGDLGRPAGSAGKAGK